MTLSQLRLLLEIEAGGFQETSTNMKDLASLEEDKYIYIDFGDWHVRASARVKIAAILDLM